VISSPSQPLFFCTGFAKSGTTYLQALLNAHPQIACAPEQDLRRLNELLAEAASQYNRRSITLDLRTGGPGRPAFDRSALFETMRAATLAILRSYAAGKPIVGAKDNRLMVSLEGCAAAFPNARFLCIVRNPLDRAVSAWHHNLRLAEREQDPRHREILLQPGGSLDAWALHICRLHQAEFPKFQSAQLGERRLVLRYEDLVLDPLPQLRRVLGFLCAEASPAILESLLRVTSLGALRDRAVDPGFFRTAAVAAGAGELAQTTRREAAALFASEFAALGYRVTDDGLELAPAVIA